MTVDHSQTYKRFQLRNIPHILRKKQLSKQVSKFPKNLETYTDFGCSNGYLTNEFSDILSPNKTTGYDHSVENLKIANANYPRLCFSQIDLNKENTLVEKSDIITCFETLEHVGDIQNALQTIKNSCQSGTHVLISVPIEIGFWGVIKYVLKRFVFKYDLPLNCNDRTYFIALLSGKDISQYRKPSNGYGAHFGFDYRIVDEIISAKFSNCSIKKFNSFTTRFYCIKVKNGDNFQPRNEN